MATSFPNYGNYSNYDYQKSDLTLYSEYQKYRGGLARNREKRPGKEGRPMQTNWANEHLDALREYLAKGMSYSETAKAINARFKTAYSRSAAIGRARRMGVAGPGRAKDLPVFAQASARAAASIATAASQIARTPCTRIHSADADFRAHADRQAPLCRGRSSPYFAYRSPDWGLPLPLRWRQRGRSHHLLRTPAPPRLKLLHSAFSSDTRPRQCIGTIRGHHLTSPGGGSMKRRTIHRLVVTTLPPPPRAFA
jgi:GcrA cell cycle regulator